MRVRRTLAAALAASVTATLTAIGLTAVAVPTTNATTASPTHAAQATGAAETGDGTRALLRSYAKDTWHSFVAMVHPRTGLPDDNIGGDLRPGSRGGYTSPTNIGAYLWSTVAARDIGLISAEEARERMARTLRTVAQLERHTDSGMFYNWYDPATGAKLREFPGSGDPIKPFLSSVDNGWLATCSWPAAPSRGWQTRPRPSASRWTSPATTTPRSTRSAAGSGTRTRATRPTRAATTAA
jgi:hypothetical protein